MYKATSHKATHDAEAAEAAEAILGITDTDKLTISVRPSLPRSLKAQTLLHEVLHTLTHLTGLEKELGEKKEEAVVTRLAPALLAVLIDNPKLVAYILESK